LTSLLCWDSSYYLNKYVKREIMKLDTKHKAKIRREVDLELGVKAPKKIIFKSKKIYTRKSKHKKK